MTEEEISTTIETYLASINDEYQYIDPLYKPLKAIVGAFQRAPRPKGSYALVTMIGVVDNGEADHTCYGEAVILSLSQQATNPDLKSAPMAIEQRLRSILTKVRIDVYSRQAVSYANVLRGAFLSNRASTDLSGLIPRTIGDVNYLPVLIGQEWEGQANFEVELAGLNRTDNAIDVIESGRVEMTGTGSQTIETEFTYQKE